MSLASTLATPGLSLYSIPAAWFIAFYPNFLKGALIRKRIGFNNAAPRENVARLAEDKKTDAAVIAKIRRIEAAHHNGNEALPLWASAVIAANLAGVDTELLNKISLVFITLRVLYNHIYFGQTTQARGDLRSIVWAIATSLPIYLLVKSGNLVRAGGKFNL